MRRVPERDASPSAARGEQLAPFGELADAGVRLFTDDGTGVQNPLLMRRAMEYALGLDVVLAQHCEVSGPDARCRDARRAVLQRARPARLAGPRRGADGPPRPRAVAAHRRADPPPAPVDGRQRRACPPGQGRRGPRHGRGHAAPPGLTDEQLRGYDSRVQGQSAAAHEGRCRGARSRASSTGRSTPSPPTMPRTRPLTRSSRSTRPRPGWSGWRRRSVSACRSSATAGMSVAGRRRGVGVEAGGDRRDRRASRRTDRRRATGQPRRVRRRRVVGSRSRQARQPQPQHPVRRSSAARRGRATRCSTGSPTVDRRGGAPSE